MTTTQTDYIGIAKRGQNKGRYYIDSGATMVEVDIWVNRDDRPRGFRSSGRKYLYPNEGEYWEITSFYFDKRSTATVFLFKDGKFTPIKYREYNTRGQNLLVREYDIEDDKLILTGKMGATSDSFVSVSREGSA